MLVAAQIREDAGLLTLLLETTQGALEGFSILHPDTGQILPPSLPVKNVMRLDDTRTKTHGYRAGAKLPFAVYCPPTQSSRRAGRSLSRPFSAISLTRR